ncbi:MAG: hypothetical protein ACREAY_11995, partial [Nitrososphaera sp.]|uniref:hypothetical protein n=1 Tax=Nitrososphaera sp. TaxID=1971748 RepID=UPI003D6F0197
ARPMHGLRTKRAFIVNFFFRCCTTGAISLFNAGRTVATDPAPAFGCQAHASLTGQTSSLSAFASFPASFCAFSIYFLRSDGAFGSLSAPFHVKKV